KPAPCSTLAVLSRPWRRQDAASTGRLEACPTGPGLHLRPLGQRRYSLASLPDEQTTLPSPGFEPHTRNSDDDRHRRGSNDRNFRIARRVVPGGSAFGLLSCW